MSLIPKVLCVLFITISFCFSYSYTKNEVPEGWASQGAGTTGGQGGTEIEVSSIEQLNSAIGSSDKKIILVKPGTYNGNLQFSKSDKSVLGTAPGVIISGNITISAKNIIIRNITVQGGKCGDHDDCGSKGDAIYIGGKESENIWLDHLDVLDGNDGNCDVTKGPTNITITWCKFYYTYKKAHPFSNLIAGSDNETESKDRLNITYAYNWWGDYIRERMPRGRFGKIHVLNNLYTSKRCNYILGPGHMMEMLIEHNVFNTTAEQTDNDPARPGQNYGIGKNEVVQDMASSGTSSWKSIGNIGTNPGDKNTNKGTVFTPPYTIKKYDANEVEAMVSKEAGAIMTLGESSVFDIAVRKNNRVQPRITSTKAGWTLKNPGTSTLSFVVVTLNGQSLLPLTKLEAGNSIELPSATSTLLIKFNGNNAPSDIHIPNAR